MQASYLGPEDSYSHVATRQILDGLDAEIIPCQTITNVFKASTPYAVVPISNTIQGVVQETLLNLIHPETHASENGSAATKWEIVGSHTLSVQHNLVVRRGVELKDVDWVGSHEQALGQCSKYLDVHCPQARRIPFPSTAQAAILLASRASSKPSSSKSINTGGAAGAGQDVTVVTDDNDERLRGHGAAICSSAIIERLESSLEVVAESVQNVKENYTRFLLLRQRNLPPNPPIISRSTGKSTFLVTSSPSSLHDLPEEHRVLELHKHETGTSVSKKKFGVAASGPQSGPRYLVEVEGVVGEAAAGEWVVLGST